MHTSFTVSHAYPTITIERPKRVIFRDLHGLINVITPAACDSILPCGSTH